MVDEISDHELQIRSNLQSAALTDRQLRRLVQQHIANQMKDAIVAQRSLQDVASEQINSNINHGIDAAEFMQLQASQAIQPDLNQAVALTEQLRSKVYQPDGSGTVTPTFDTSTQSPDQKAAAANKLQKDSAYCPPEPTKSGTPDKKPEPPVTSSPPPSTKTQPPSQAPTESGPFGIPILEIGNRRCDLDFWSRQLESKGIKLGEIDVGKAVTKLLQIKSSPAGVLDFATAPVDTIVQSLFQGLSSLGKGATDRTTDMIRDLIRGEDCELSSQMGPWLLRLLISFVSHWFAPDFKELSTDLDYYIHGLCPKEYPSASEALDLYLGDAIDEKTARSWTAINNKCWQPQERLLQIKRSKPVPQELADLRLRGILSATEYDAGMRRLGYTDKSDRDNIFKLTDAIPSPEHLIQWMVRDIADEDVVRHFRFNDLFEAKYKGKLKDWANKQGVSDNYMLAAWQAHWVLPSPGQLYEMYQRNRHFPVGDDRRVELKDLEQALRHNDVLPFWIPKLISVSFKPIGIRYIRSAYQVGAIKFQDLIDLFSQLGFSDENSRTMADGLKLTRDAGIQNSLPIKQWKAELIDKAEAERMLVVLDFSPQAIADALAVAGKAQKNHSAIKQFSKFQLTRLQAEIKLTDHGIPETVYKEWLDVAALSYQKSPAVRLFAAQRIARAEAEQRLNDSGIGPENYNTWLDDAATNWANHWAIEEYQDGTIELEQARQELTADGMSDGAIASRLDRVAARVKAKQKAKCMNHLVKRFAKGEFTEADLRAMLIGQQLNALLIETAISEAKCELQVAGKEASGQQLCEWFSLGLIDENQLVVRLQNIGWNHADAIRVLVSCSSKLSARRQKDAEAVAKKDAAAMEKVRRNQERQQVAAEKKVIELRKRAETARKAASRREKMLLDSADKLRAKTGESLSDSVSFVRQLYKAARTESALSVDNALQATVASVEAYIANNNQSLEDIYSEVVAELIALDQTDSEVAQSGASNSNGVT